MFHSHHKNVSSPFWTTLSLSTCLQSNVNNALKVQGSRLSRCTVQVRQYLRLTSGLNLNSSGIKSKFTSIQPPGPGFISAFLECFWLIFRKELFHSEREMHVKTQPSDVQIPQISSICSVYDIHLLNALCKDERWVTSVSSGSGILHDFIIVTVLLKI